jgi:hypothetical protein
MRLADRQLHEPRQPMLEGLAPSPVFPHSRLFPNHSRLLQQRLFGMQRDAEPVFPRTKRARGAEGRGKMEDASHHRSRG